LDDVLAAEYVQIVSKILYIHKLIFPTQI